MVLKIFTNNYNAGVIKVSYKGIFPCFFHGFSSFLVASTSKSRQILFRVM